MLVKSENRGGTLRFWPGHTVVYPLIRKYWHRRDLLMVEGLGGLKNVVSNIMNFHCLQHIKWVVICVWRSEKMARLEVQICASFPRKI